jgi:hypothetical protein
MPLSAATACGATAARISAPARPDRQNRTRQSPAQRAHPE